MTMIGMMMTTIGITTMTTGITTMTTGTMMMIGTTKIGTDPIIMTMAIRKAPHAATAASSTVLNTFFK